MRSEDFFGEATFYGARFALLSKPFRASFSHFKAKIRLFGACLASFGFDLVGGIYFNESNKNRPVDQKVDDILILRQQMLFFATFWGP